MKDIQGVCLNDWPVMEVQGSDAGTFLQNMATQELRDIPTGEARYALFLTPRGKFVADAWITRTGDVWHLGIHRSIQPALERHFTMYRLRLQVTWRVRRATLLVMVGLPEALGELNMPGWRGRVPWTDGEAWMVWTEREALPKTVAWMDPETWHRWRRTVGWVWPSVDLTGQEWMPLEAMMMHAISYTKGCYVGQEVVAKATYLGHPPRQLMQIVVHPPEGHTPDDTWTLLWREQRRSTFGWSPAYPPGPWVGWAWVPHQASLTEVDGVLQLPDGETISARVRVAPWLAKICALYPPPKKRG